MCAAFRRTRKDVVPVYFKVLSCNGQERLRKTTVKISVTSVLANIQKGHHPKTSQNYYYFR
jgi:hypothetical protein